MSTFRRLSGAGASALSIWELSGSLEQQQALFGDRLPQASRPLRLDRKSLPFDEALLWAREDGALECHLHGGFGVAAAFRAWLEERGWQEREQGLSPLCRATSPLAARVALAQEDGRGERALDQAESLHGAERAAACAALQDGLVWAERLHLPPRLVLAGAADVGKSSLFNLWHQASLATTASGAGTTRDPVAARLGLGKGWDRFHVDLIDSAGLGEPKDALDAAAMDMTRQAIAEAWCVLWVLDAATPPESAVLEALGKRRPQDLLLLNRTDRRRTWSPKEFGLKPDLRGFLGEGKLWIRRIEAKLLKRFGPVPSADAVVLQKGAQRRRLEALLQSTD
ncbi:MAG: GTPase [Planctomycetota bacterium]